MDDTVAIFLMEAEELLITIEQTALQITRQGVDIKLIGELFRALHTLKGSGDQAGFTELKILAHELETAWVMVRDGRKMSEALPDLTLEAKDQFQAILVGGANPAVTESIITRCAGLYPESSPTTRKSKQKDFGIKVTYLITVDPGEDAFFTIPGPIEALNQIHQLGDCQIEAYLDRVPNLKTLDLNSCYVYWTIVLKTTAMKDKISALFPLWTYGDEFHIEGPLV